MRLVVQMVRYYVAHGPLADQPTPANCKVAPYVLLRTLPWKELTGSLRTDWCGRPWARVAYRLIRRDAQAKVPELERDLQPRHAELVSALRLEEATAPYGLLYCELVRARRLLVSYWKRTGEATSKAPPASRTSTSASRPRSTRPWPRRRRRPWSRS